MSLLSEKEVGTILRASARSARSPVRERTMEPHDWLDSEEQFEAFRMRIVERLQERRAARSGFLQNVVRTLEPVIAEARELRAPEIEAQLQTCRDVARA